MKFLRILFKLVIALVVVVATALGLVYWRSSALLAQHIDVREPALTIPADADALARGQHIAITRGCTDCHDKDLGGRVLVDAFPIGRLAAPNLTRGKGGVGVRLDAASLERAIRHGLGEDGRLLLYMPTSDFNALTDADTADLIAYVSTVAPVDRDIPAPTAGPLMRTLFVLDKAPLAYALRVDQHAAHAATMAPAATAEYGRYLANSCTGCHGEHFSGGRVPGTPPSFPPARNITPDPANGIGKWSKADFSAAVRLGKRPDGSTLNSFMPWKAFATLTDMELDALWAYLQTVPARAVSEH
ncbi:MAG TPA: c-type cytochrome [Rudaea sp.]|nr:c-type cytochrome [Rudaea sp.]